MSTKVFCDLCGKEITATTSATLKLSLSYAQTKAGGTQETKGYDTCSACWTKLKAAVATVKTI